MGVTGVEVSLTVLTPSTWLSMLEVSSFHVVIGGSGCSGVQYMYDHADGTSSTLNQTPLA